MHTLFGEGEGPKAALLEVERNPKPADLVLERKVLSIMKKRSVIIKVRYDTVRPEVTFDVEGGGPLSPVEGGPVLSLCFTAGPDKGKKIRMAMQSADDMDTAAVLIRYFTVLGLTKQASKKSGGFFRKTFSSKI